MTTTEQFVGACKMVDAQVRGLLPKDSEIFGKDFLRVWANRAGSTQKQLIKHCQRVAKHNGQFKTTDEVLEFARSVAGDQ